MKELLPGLRQFGTEAPDSHSGAIYLVGEGAELALVDAGSAANYASLREELADVGITPQDIQAVYITHGHSDHYEGAIALRKESDADIYIGEADRASVAVGDYWKTAGFYYGKHSESLPGTKSIGDGYERRFGGVTLRAIETPGHTMGSITYELEIPEAAARVALLGDLGWGGWHEKIGSDLEAWRASVGKLQQRRYTHVSFGHCVNVLVSAEPHLTLLHSQIGVYGNAYDTIPEHYFVEPKV
jgi:glyoxylase-like metal-dependent hydrolase (beta-lactamase superfamily II)